MKDVIVVGSGPAGALAAEAASKGGLDVLLVDHYSFPRDKPCGGAMGIKSLKILSEKDILLPSSTKIAGLHIVSPTLKYNAKFGNSYRGFLVTRSEFDDYLHRRALKAGAEFAQANIAKVENLNGVVEVKSKNHNYKAKILIIANGVHSKLPTQLGFENKYNQKSVGYTINSETPIEEDILTDIFTEKKFISLFFGPVARGYGWVFPKKESLNIGIGCTRKYLTHALDEYKKFLSIIQKYFQIRNVDFSKPRGFLVPFDIPRKEIVTNNVMIAGDAAWMVSALSGEGICYSLFSGKCAGETAVDAINKNNTSKRFLKSYQDNWLRSYGKDLTIYAKRLQNIVYKSNNRMELLVKFAAKDEKLMSTITDSIFGNISYKETLQKLIQRLPISLLKSAKKTMKVEELIQKKPNV